MESHPNFPNLLSPIRMREVEIRNRTVFSAHAVLLNDAQLPTERLLDYYVERARGGVGLIVFEIGYVHPMKPFDTGPFISMHKPGCGEMWERINEAVHAEGATIIQQLADAGRQKFGQETLEPIMGPSPIPWSRGGELPRPMNEADIAEMVEAFARGAELSRAAGFDGVELHGAHGYLIQQFLSRASNQREDEYGGSIENRVRFPNEVIDAVRAAVGEDLIFGIRLDAEEFVPDGMNLDEAKEIAKLVTASGKLDYVTISGGSFAAGQSRIVPPMYRPHGTYAAEAKAVREELDGVPVVAVGRITDAELGEALIAGETADQVVMTRALIADPELPNKARDGRLEEIRHCLGANECIGRVHHNFRVACVFNAEAGEEAKYRRGGEYAPADASRDVLVVGGGPGGCEAARRAAEHGHRVRLFDAGRELGGQIRLAALPPGRDEFLEVPRYYTDALERLGVEVNLGTTVTTPEILAAEADHVILAIGSRPVVPTAVAAARETEDDWLALDVREALTREIDFGDNVIVYVESRYLEGLVTADFCRQRGANVRIVVRNTAAGGQIDDTTRQVLFRRLGEAGVPWTFRHELTKLESEQARATFTDLGSGSAVVVEEVSALIYDCGLSPDTRLAEELGESELTLHSIGDSVSPRNMVGAVKDGARVASALV